MSMKGKVLDSSIWVNEDMDKTKLTVLGLCVCVTLALGCMSQTQGDQPGAATPQGQQPGQQGDDATMKLPPAMAEECVGKTANDACELSFNDTTINGTCRTIRNGNLTCFPINTGQGRTPKNGSQQRIRPAPGGEMPKDNSSQSIGGNQE